MTPYEIKLLLHYHCSPTEPDGYEPIRADTKAQFIALGLLETCEPNEHGCNVVATEKLHYYCSVLCDTPLPIQRWVMPDGR